MLHRLVLFGFGKLSSILLSLHHEPFAQANLGADTQESPYYRFEEAYLNIHPCTSHSPRRRFCGRVQQIFLLISSALGNFCSAYGTLRALCRVNNNSFKIRLNLAVHLGLD